MPPRKRAELVVAMPNHGQAQANFDTPMSETVLTRAWQMTSDSYPAIDRELDRYMNCTNERLIGKELIHRIMRFSMDYEANGTLMGQIEAYRMGVAAAPTGTPANQVQTFTVTATAGLWRIGILIGQYVKYTQYLAWNATALVVKAAIENLTAIGRGNTTVTLVGSVYTVTFVNNLARAQMPQFTVDGALLTAINTIVPAQTTAGVQLSHGLSEIATFQPPAFGFIVGYRNSARLPRRYDSVVVDSHHITGSDSTPRLTANVAVVGSANLIDAGGAYILPACEIFRPMRFKDCKLVIDGVDYSAQPTNGNRWVDFDLTANNGIITDNDAYTSQDEDVHRLERADERPFMLNVGILGEKGDDIYNLAEELAEVAVTLTLGRSNNGLVYTIPKASLSLQNPETTFYGTGKRTKVQISIEPEEISGDATTPYTVQARNAETGTLLIAA